MKFDRMLSRPFPASKTPSPYRGVGIPRWKKLLGMPADTLLVSLETGKTYRVGDLRACFDPQIANRVDWFDRLEGNRPVEKVWVRFLRVVYGPRNDPLCSCPEFAGPEPFVPTPLNRREDP